MISIRIIISFLMILHLVLFFWCCKKNQLALHENSVDSYAFFVAGHTYGKPGVDNIGFHPPFKEKFYLLEDEKIKFGILTGDIVWTGTAQNWDEIDKDIDSLGKPVYFAAGNHDMTDRALFEKRYGLTYYYFLYQKDLFIILDPNLDHWNISGEQLAFLNHTIKQHVDACNAIFVFFHQLLWWQADNRYRNVIPNSFSGRADSINFWTEVEPLLHGLCNPVVLFAGDVGAGSWSADYMFHCYDNMTLIASGMGEGVGDNFIIVHVNADRTVTYDLIALFGNDINGFGDLTDFELP
jgi:hypothetical protein